MFKIFFALSLWSYQALSAEFIVWNVGQGQWITEVHSAHCLHYDLGGEKNPIRKVLQLCKGKKNILHLSHWDWDHISYAAGFALRAPNTCLVEIPDGKPSEHKRRQIDSIRICTEDEREFGKKRSVRLFDPEQSNTSNGLSEVFFSSAFQVLIPGDSPKSQEKIWARFVPKRSFGLILGHHGSRTSSSEILINRLRNLKWAVASARTSRYGHPHKQVVQRLKKEKVPLLKTEDWGHLHFLSKDF